MIVVSYYTNRKYKAMANVLKDSCTAVGLHCAVFAVKDEGSWQKNVYQKPHVIRKAMAAYPAEDILFIDADAKVVRYPNELISTDWEVAAYFEGPHLPVSGTVFLVNTPRVHAVVDAWAAGCDRGEGLNEDFHWMSLALRTVPTLRIGYLPPSYFWKEKEMRGRFPTAEPVVEHFTVGEHSFK